MGCEQYGSSGPKSSLACPHAGESIQSTRLVVHKEPQRGLRHGRGDNNRGIKPLDRKRFRGDAVEGLDWFPSAGAFALTVVANATNRQIRATNVTRCA